MTTTRADLEALADEKRPDNPPAFPIDGRIRHGTAYDGMSMREARSRRLRAYLLTLK